MTDTERTFDKRREVAARRRSGTTHRTVISADEERAEYSNHPPVAEGHFGRRFTVRDSLGYASGLTPVSPDLPMRPIRDPRSLAGDFRS